MGFFASPSSTDLSCDPVWKVTPISRQSELKSRSATIIFQNKVHVLGFTYLEICPNVEFP